MCTCAQVETLTTCLRESESRYQLTLTEQEHQLVTWEHDRSTAPSDAMTQALQEWIATLATRAETVETDLQHARGALEASVSTCAALQAQLVALTVSATEREHALLTELDDARVCARRQAAAHGAAREEWVADAERAQEAHGARVAELALECERTSVGLRAATLDLTAAHDRIEALKAEVWAL